MWYRKKFEYYMFVLETGALWPIMARLIFAFLADKSDNGTFKLPAVKSGLSSI